MTTPVFDVLECLGRGGFGEVYRARMTTAGGLVRYVAIKFLPPQVDPHGAAYDRLRNEAMALASVDHRAIVTEYDLVVIDGRTALVMELLDGQDVSTVIDDGPVPERVALAIVREVASALHAASTAVGPDGTPMCLVHRDVKPSNIRVRGDGSVKLLDFGIVKDSDGESTATATGQVVGTPGYVAPERMRLEPTTGAVDVYSLGCVLFELLKGERLYSGFGQSRVLEMAIDGAVHDRQVASRIGALEGVEPRICALITRMVAADPTHRPNAVAVEEACDELLDELSGEGLIRWARQRRWGEPPALAAGLTGRRVWGTATQAALAPPQLDRRGPRWGWAIAAVGGLVAIGVAAAVAVTWVPADGYLEVTGDLEVAVQRDGQTYAPGTLPAGRYQLVARHGDERWVVGQADVHPGQTATVVCDAAAGRCTQR